jgi:5-methyltetrahydrofolate--homocysteine methyltransferase
VDLNKISEAVISGDASGVEKLTNEAISSGLAARSILNNGLVAGMTVVADKFKGAEFFLPEVLLSARAMKTGMEILRPELTRAGVEPIGKVVIGTLQGDLHDIGKNIVIFMLEGAGLRVIDLGINVSAGRFADAVREHEPDVLGMSALLTTTMTQMPDVIETLRECGLRERVKVVVGGAPLSQQYADRIQADAYADDAGSALFVVKKLLKNA